MEWITDNWKLVLDVVAYVVLAFSIIAKMTKNTWDDNIAGKLLRLLSMAPSNPAKPKV